MASKWFISRLLDTMFITFMEADICFQKFVMFGGIDL